MSARASQPLNLVLLAGGCVCTLANTLIATLNAVRLLVLEKAR